MNEEAQRVIERMLSDPEYYAECSTKEQSRWGGELADEDIRQAKLREIEAARSLKIHPQRVGLAPALRRNGLQPVEVLSLACGEGRAERDLLAAGIGQSYHGIDISPDAVAKARELAEQEGLPITYSVADLNELDLPEATYDLVVTQNCLHHILRLEHVRDQIARTLKPGGLLWMHDFVGETQFQWLDERIQIANQLLEVLPERYKKSTVHPTRPVAKIARRPPGRLGSPFEAIRSAEILPVFLERFEVVDGSDFDSILALVAPVGTRGTYASSEDGVALFQILGFLDRLLIEKEILPACGATRLLRLRAEDASP